MSKEVSERAEELKLLVRVNDALEPIIRKGIKKKLPIKNFIIDLQLLNSEKYGELLQEEE